MTVSIPLTEDAASKLRALAEKDGLSSEEFLRRQVEGWLQNGTDDFRAAAKHVIEKNAELYRRLA